MVKSKRGGKRVAKRGGKRGGNRYVRKYQPNTVNAKGTLAVPDRMLLRLPYYEAIKWSGNPQAYYDWNLNSIYDPNRSGIGHQPLGYDQWKLLYNRYRVVGVKARFSATNLSDVPVRVGIVGDNQPSGAIYLSDVSMFEQPHMKSFILGSANGVNTRSFTMFFSPAKITGSPMYRYKSDNQYQAQWSSNPSEIIVAHTIGRSLDGETALDVHWDVHFTYIIEAFDRLTLSLSNTQEELRGPENNVDTEDARGPTGATGPTGPVGS